VVAHLDKFEGQANRRNPPADGRYNPDHFLTNGDSNAAQGAGLQVLGAANQQAGRAEVNHFAGEAAAGTQEGDRYPMRCPKPF